VLAPALATPNHKAMAQMRGQMLSNDMSGILCVAAPVNQRAIQICGDVLQVIPVFAGMTPRD
jgi:hypothetical protein